MIAMSAACSAISASHVAPAVTCPRAAAASCHSLGGARARSPLPRYALLPPAASTGWVDGATGRWARVNLGHQLAHKLLRLEKQLRIRHGHLERLALGLRLGRRTGTRVDGHRVAAACARR
jgi:hypothetical protein